MDTHDALRQVFSWSFLGTITSAGIVVVAVANTLRRLFRWPPVWAALAASLVLTGYAAFVPEGAIRGKDIAPILIFTVLVFCYAVGINQSVVGISQRSAKVQWQPGGWWDTWL